ncbi:MAG: hypothetical protein LBP28_05745 [Coriobacteriales bacterium]|jgi:hypothetical protein|nr:hypothetical protein [Coriobacteriales bacterium]
MKTSRFIEGQLVVFLNATSILEPLAVVGVVDSINDDVLFVRYSNDHYIRVPVAEAFPIQNAMFALTLAPYIAAAATPSREKEGDGA